MINAIKKLLKNKYRVFIIFITILFLAFYGLWNVVSGGYDKQNKVILLLKKVIPTKLARKIRDTVFIIPDLRERNQFLELVMKKHDQGLNGEVFNEETFISKKNKNTYILKEFFLPFPRLDLRLGWASTTNTLRKHYFDIVKDKVLVISGEGQTIYFDKNNVNEKKLNQKNIPNNLQEILKKNNYNPMGIRDLFIEDSKVYISLYFKNFDGFSMDIYQADLNFDKLEFKLFFKSNQFWDRWTVRTGGRIGKYKKNKILISIGDAATKNAAQDLNSLLGKIISIDKNTKKHEIVSIGHRNPQGLLYLEDSNTIINTEHGPKGGDEVNINYLSENEIPNFGWDISSYGSAYSGKDPYKKSHIKYGFTEPFKNYTPAIGISQITYNSSDGNYLYVASLRAGSIYVLKTNEKMDKILDEERIYFPDQRIRDIKYDKEKNMLFILFESIPSIGVLKLKR